jgi:LDH2 family malate/lactate/ureidoglycolate dehydrogenase
MQRMTSRKRTILLEHKFSIDLVGHRKAGVVKKSILLDFAISAAAQGKLMVARAEHEPIPEGWILDAEGRSTTDVEAYFAGGALLPFAAHKGHALSVIVELMAVGLGGGDSVPKTERGSCL